MFSKILVANRGEIAVRVIRTCRELGIGSVAVYSDPDRDSLHTRLADEAAALDGAGAKDTYLDQNKIIAAAVASGAEAIHPGYGFLAENAGFARAVDAAGLTFIGPPAAAIEAMGEKVAARETAGTAGVPQVPGSKGAITTVDEVVEFGRQHGYPLAIKASYGGGGRGMRTVWNEGEAAEAFEAARRESAAAFGRDEVYIERYLANARHVEVQVFADTHGTVVWLGDRDCSVQRRHQKLVEEAPAPGLSPRLRQAMGEASVRLASAVGYVGAGTVEYLVEAERDAFYFLEMNTRIQVEHPVTEETLGLDLIAEQIRVAGGGRLSVTSSGPSPRGHAIEIRVNAEDVAEGAFRPSPGPVSTLRVPVRPGVRFDGGYDTGDEVLPYYDSLVGKLVVWAPTRSHAIERALGAVAELQIEGIPTTLPAATVILNHADFQNARISTRWLEHEVDLPALLPAPGVATDPDDSDHPDHADQAAENDELLDRQEVYVGGRLYRIPLPAAPTLTAVAAPSAAARNGTAGRRRGEAAARRPKKAAAGTGALVSPMQGTVIKINVKEGDLVEEGRVVLVLEAMKMENPIRAAIAGTVTSLLATPGLVVSTGTLLGEITPSAG
ncbi:biotin carboxylase N-terminal domain-containing protein [Parafrankia sp. BMG5.11]|uniref:acetyl/propionyl/methylcrotonyl-CoA carboxylase subunit alpha n=1 Tax=Parafrankia sp. BMG5.11 TaxID=222540 RepID=UPI00103FBAE7|nr:biotin carboxylase N-terminal domain-containing protein [Parafrankia sp. BMG5.11]TCJ33508.1 ATP-grasp domain-containing protein [Parafrankia sp. BMG5.11]